jgi:hypothetical protein
MSDRPFLLLGAYGTVGGRLTKLGAEEMAAMAGQAAS